MPRVDTNIPLMLTVAYDFLVQFLRASMEMASDTLGGVL